MARTINETQVSEVVELAWDDKASFDTIKRQTGLAEGDVIKVMRQNLKPRSFELWRKRVTGRKAKHEGLAPMQR